jgi:opacity protein-like surface antigen
MTKILILSLALIPLAAFAESEWTGGQFEVNALYGRTDGKLNNSNSYGGSIAGGYYIGDHLLQLEVGVLMSENLGGFTDATVNPANPAQNFVYNQRKSELQDIPVWVNYRYGVSFGPNDMFRFEAGPTIGARVRTLRNNYDLVITEVGQPTRFVNGEDAQSGDLVFDYGAGATLRCRFTQNWSLTAGYKYIRTLSADFESRVRELDSVSAYVFYPSSSPSHGTHYASVGVEYRF